MFKTFIDAWKIPDLRKRMLFVIFILILYRLGAVIPVPFISSDMLNYMISFSEGSMLQYMNILSGQAFSRATLFALSISPYINASIIMQLLTVAIPALENLQKSGRRRQKERITQITRYVTSCFRSDNLVRLLHVHA